ncbi:MAG: hypothetical protein E7553_04055 [Ruminococcaceae bacterium]|nr:hypothetical protein [Oscillospiraceae bacterium]
MKSTHITKAIALVMTLMMLLSCVPSSVLPVFALSASEQSTSIFDNVVLGKGTVTNTESYLAGAVTDSKGNAIVDKTLSPYEPYSTDDENHPFLPGGSANITLDKIYYGAPATQNYPLTAWSANTSVHNITGTGVTYGEKYPSITSAYPAYDDEIYSLPDMNLVDEYLWASLNHSVGSKATENGIASSKNTLYGQSIVDSKNSTEAMVYNRFDPMQGKWGLTLDCNVSSVRWTPSYVENYYGTTSPADRNDKNLNNTYLFLTDTPYLYFSTEALSTTKMAISLLIGAPIQAEKPTEASKNSGKFDTQVTQSGAWEYRWYTVTDNIARPGIGEDTLDNSMVPNVYISKPVATEIASENVSDAITAIDAAGKLSPIDNAVSEGAEEEQLYTTGSLTGCIDFTQLLPMVMSVTNSDGKSNGREGIRYKVAQIRIDTQSTGEDDSACRLNYLYFGPAMSTVYTPQSTVGNTVNAANWMYAQHDGLIGDENPNDIGQQHPEEFWGKWYIGAWPDYDTFDCSYTNGWENGQTVSITNTPNTPQLMTIDTNGKGNGQLISFNQYKEETGKEFVRSSQKYDTNSKYLDETTTEKSSCVWKYTDDNGNVQYVEADYNQSNGAHYIMVTIPYRKWINVLGNSRKLSMTINVQKYGKAGNLDPAFGLWGNTDGAVGAGHGGLGLTTRFKSENILGIFGTGYYQIDNDDNFICAKVDMTLGESTIYNDATGTKESWFDLLRSPYMYDRTVKGAAPNFFYGEEMTGYSFVSAFRFAVPVGTEFTVQNTKGDGNSAGLNMFSTSGSIVSAYDGGTGDQPEIDMTNTTPELQASLSGTTFSYASMGNISGTQNDRAAAYGPYMPASYYTIYDLLDTELMNASGKDSHAASNSGKNVQPFYGRGYILKHWNSDLQFDKNIYNVASTNGSVLGKTHGVGNGITAYATVAITEGDEVWALVGVLQSDGTPGLGWVQICRSGAWFVEGNSINGTLVNSGKLVASYTTANYNTWYADGMNNKVINLVRDTLENNWYASNFTSEYGGSDPFLNGITKSAPTGVDIYYNNHPTLQYANQYLNTRYTHNDPQSRESFKLKSINGGTDLSLDFKRSSHTPSGANSSFGMTRTLRDPILINSKTDKENSYEKESLENSYPVLYYDYTNNATIQIALTVTVNGTPSLYYLDGASGTLTTTKTSLASGTNCGYYSLEKLIKQIDSGAAGAGKDIYIAGISAFMYYGSATSNTSTIRRLEILKAEEEWLDAILSANQYSTAGHASSDDMTAKVFDSTNIINDSFYHKHDESADGKYEITGDKNAWTYTDKTTDKSYKKENSNKGWTAQIRVDTNGDNKLGGSDPLYNSTAASVVDGVYEYRSALGHLRMWVPAKAQASVAFTADRSYNIENFRYLYYSYSMRDAGGIAAAKQDGINGLTVAIKSQQNSSDKAYVERDGTWCYFQDGVSYWSDQAGQADQRIFSTSMNACMDLQSLKFDNSVKSINQFVFYLNNRTDVQAEYYINYVYLSNEPPTQLISNKLEETQWQYYYMMDNTGDRYSARFPTIDNPTGQVSGTNADNDRVNPIKVQRGMLLSSGTYFNGDPIASYGDAPAGTTFDETKGSVGYYERNYGGTDAVKNILFYTGSGNTNDIDDYYEFKNRGRVYTTLDENGKLITVSVDEDDEANVYDMLWSFGRWFSGQGESGLNILYIGDPELDDKYKDANYNAGALSGGLSRRYATENYVLLRAGITPKTYTTYFDANGGEFIYDTSADNVTDLRQVTENNYFVTENVILSYFRQPYNIDSMKGDTGDRNTEFLKKPGYKFSHWEHYTDYTTKNESFNVVDGKVTAEDGNGARFMTFIKKTGATPDYFKAVWVVDTDTYPADERHHAKFLDTNGDVLKTITVGGETVDVNARYGRFLLNFPNTTVLYTGHDKVSIYGWQIQGDTSGRIFSAGEKIYLLDDGEFMDDTNTITFVPVTSPDKMNTFEITLHNAELFVKVKNYANQIVDRPAEDYGITLRKSGNEYTYSGVMENYSLVAKPVASAKNAENGWTLVVENAAVSQKKHVINGLVPVLSENSERYEFTAHENIEISYSSITSTIANAFYTANEGIYVTTSPRLTTDGNKGANKPAVYFTSQFTIDDDNVVYEDILASGTLLTKSTYYDKFADVNTAFALDMSTVTADTVANKTYKTMDTKAVRSLQATAVSSNYEYTAYIGHTKAEPATYYARAYVIYKDGDTVKVAYSDVIAWDIGSYTA